MKTKNEATKTLFGVFSFKSKSANKALKIGIEARIKTEFAMPTCTIVLIIHKLLIHMQIPAISAPMFSSYTLAPSPSS